MASSQQQQTLLCGPLLRYTHIDHKKSVWNGTIMVVVLGTGAPTLDIKPAIDNAPVVTELFLGPYHTFWRFSVAVPLEDVDLKVVYKLSLAGSTSVSEFEFWVPAKDETMRMMFHTCNGYTLIVKDNASAGPVLWKDVLRVHKETPFHVMIGGGDQVYSDGVRTKGPLERWASDPSPRRKAKMELTRDLKKELDKWYFENYCEAYNKGAFREAASSIPSVQIFDDHDIMFERLDKMVNDETKHLILLLGVPIAYPRLVWLERLLPKHMVRAMTWICKQLGVAENFFNKFDGSAELLDDLNDHWCATVHKKERNAFIERLQAFSRDKSVRVTILSGDVRLACVGRFYSRESLKIPQDKDHRYMVNVVSSAITNMPPPKALVNFLSQRDKLHKLKNGTHENLMVMFKKEGSSKKGNPNLKMLAARNYCTITESAGLTNASTGAKARVANGGNGGQRGLEASGTFRTIHPRDQEGSKRNQVGETQKYALDISIHAEINPKDPRGYTDTYALSIPSLEHQSKDVTF